MNGPLRACGSNRILYEKQENRLQVTGYEMLDNVGLVHMNARIYDPLIGRFLSPDSVLQFPESIQGYNRYSYVLNNPLSFTDPSGHVIPFILGLALVAGGADFYTTVAVMFVAGVLQVAMSGAQDGDILKAGLSCAHGVGLKKRFLFMLDPPMTLLGKTVQNNIRYENIFYTHSISFAPWM